jgi:CheY-like chemotaxis protein
MTVPLKVHDEVIGTLNVESPRPNGFGPDDLQFTELFSREIGGALHTLDLLSAQQECTAAQSIEAVNKEIALPLDEVLASASVLLGRSADDPDTTARLRRILDSARRVKGSVSKVGREFAPVLPPPPAQSPGNGTYPELLAEGPTPLVGKRVLVVDADERVRRQAHLLLTRLGARVETVGTACDGLAMATDNPYDAILLEVKPADMGGFECYRRFKLARPESVLAMTTGFGYDLAHSIVKARQDGMKYVLFKPFRQDQVVPAVLDTAPAALPRPETASTA